jgi:alpha-glucosidase
MNYDAFMEPVTWFLTGVDKHSKSYNDKWRGNGKAFFEAMFKAMARFPRPALDSAINQLSNHDHSRFLTRTNGRVGTIQERGGAAAGEGIDKRVMKLAILIQMTWVGSPTLYYADEVGQVGWTDPDSRRTFPWGHEDWDLYNTYKSAIALRKKVHCIRMGSLLELDAGDGYIAYGRFDIADSLITVINSSDKEIALAVPVWQAGVTWQDKLKLAFAVGYQGASAESTVDVNYGRAYIKIPPKSGVCYYKRFSGQPMKSLRLYVGDVRFTTKFYQFKQFRHII